MRGKISRSGENLDEEKGGWGGIVGGFNCIYRARLLHMIICMKNHSCLLPDGKFHEIKNVAYY